ncbi:hypothetical protein ON010_g3875 [Phytophthora cinnamomi]|nr:hypothetical protein ON010_g3875 [Phytophthora cinnamomi]
MTADGLLLLPRALHHSERIVVRLTRQTCTVHRDDKLVGESGTDSMQRFLDPAGDRLQEHECRRLHGMNRPLAVIGLTRRAPHGQRRAPQPRLGGPNHSKHGLRRGLKVDCLLAQQVPQRVAVTRRDLVRGLDEGDASDPLLLVPAQRGQEGLQQHASVVVHDEADLLRRVGHDVVLPDVRDVGLGRGRVQDLGAVAVDHAEVGARVQDHDAVAALDGRLQVRDHGALEARLGVDQTAEKRATFARLQEDAELGARRVVVRHEDVAARLGLGVGDEDLAQVELALELGVDLRHQRLHELLHVLLALEAEVLAACWADAADAGGCAASSPSSRISPSS